MTDGSAFDVEHEGLANLTGLELTKILGAEVIEDLISIRTRYLDDRQRSNCKSLVLIHGYLYVEQKVANVTVLDNVAFSLPDIGKNMLIDHYLLSQEDKPTDDKYSLSEFLEGFNDNTREGGANNAKPLADQSTMAIAGDQLSSLQNVVAHLEQSSERTISETSSPFPKE